MSNLRDKVVVVGIECGKPTLSKQDKESVRIIDQAVGGDGSVKVNKTLIDSKSLSSITRIENDFKKWQKDYVSPYNRAPRGCGIIMVEHLTEWQNQYRSHRREWEKEVDSFCDNYDDIIAESKRRQGTNFDPGELPRSKEEMRSRFKFEMVQPYALENPDDLRFALNASEIEDIRRQVSEDIMDAVKSSLTESFEAVRYLHEVLGKYDSKKRGKRYGDPALDRVRNAADALSNLNFTGNEGIEEIQKKMNDLVNGRTADSTKANPEQRKSIINDANDMMQKNFSAFGF